MLNIKAVGLILWICVGLLQLRLWFGDGGIREVLRLKKEVLAEQKIVDSLERRNDLMAAEVQDLKHHLGSLEERARIDLGMIHEGETFFRVIER